MLRSLFFILISFFHFYSVHADLWKISREAGGILNLTHTRGARKEARRQYPQRASALSADADASEIGAGYGTFSGQASSPLLTAAGRSNESDRERDLEAAQPTGDDSDSFENFRDAWTAFLTNYRNPSSRITAKKRQALLWWAGDSLNPYFEYRLRRDGKLSSHEVDDRLKKEVRRSVRKGGTVALGVGAAVTSGFITNKIGYAIQGSEDTNLFIQATSLFAMMTTFQVLATPAVNRATSYVTKASFLLEVDDVMVPGNFRNATDRSWSNYYALFSENEQVVIDLARDARALVTELYPILTSLSVLDRPDLKQELASQLGLRLFQLAVLYPFIDWESSLFGIYDSAKGAMRVAEKLLRSDLGAGGWTELRELLIGDFSRRAQEGFGQNERHYREILARGELFVDDVIQDVTGVRPVSNL